MVFKLLFLCFLIFIETIIPPAISPFSYSLIGMLLIQETNPVFLSVLVIGTSVASSIFTRFFLGYLIEKVREYQLKHHHKDRFSRLELYSHKILKKRKKINRFSIMLQSYVDSGKGGFFLFVFSFITLASALPDIVTVRVVKNHLKFRYFILAAIIGKAIAYLPVIFLGKGILALLRI